MQNNGHYAVQGYWRPSILAPMESPYATSYVSVIVIYLLSCTVSETLCTTGPILALDTGTPLVTLFGGNPLTSGWGNLLSTNQIDTSICRTMWNVFRYLEQLRRDPRVWHITERERERERDGRTDFTIANAALHCRARPKMQRSRWLLMCAQGSAMAVISNECCCWDRGSHEVASGNHETIYWL